MRWLPYLLITTCLSLAATTRSTADDDFSNSFFAFDNGTGRGQVPADEQAAMLAELGYAGVGYTGTAGIPEMLAALDKRNLQMFSIYVGVRVGKDGSQVDPSLKEAIQQLQGRNTFVWLTIQGGTASSTEFDDQAVPILRQLSDLAQASGIRIAMYPHAGFYVARVEDAIRLARKADRENVGATFNLCHWLKLDDEKNLDSVL
ncbi:MAG: sugar phosphate isomerase/epimerase family protein, partial [Pirellulaceae bacterium]